jgi:hypothetical protein
MVVVATGDSLIGLARRRRVAVGDVAELCGESFAAIDRAFVRRSRDERPRTDHNAMIGM